MCLQEAALNVEGFQASKGLQRLLALAPRPLP